MPAARPVNGGAGQASLAGYATGFVLSVMLTALAFALVAFGLLPRIYCIAAIFTAAAVQILVHLRCFLHLKASSGVAWNVSALLFTILIMLLFVGGSLWIMAHLHYRLG